MTEVISPYLLGALKITPLTTGFCAQLVRIFGMVPSVLRPQNRGVMTVGSGVSEGDVKIARAECLSCFLVAAPQIGSLPQRFDSKTIKSIYLEKTTHLRYD